MKSKKYFIDCGYTSINKIGEELCGDKVEVLKNDNNIIMVLADGLGSGVKANILATLTSKILATMLSKGANIDECVETIVNTLPICKTRKVAYSTFSIAIIRDDICHLIQYDNPKILVFRNKKVYEVESTTRMINNKKITESHFEIKVDDLIFLSSDGALHAGMSKFLNYDWTLEKIQEYIEDNLDEKYSAKNLASLLASKCNELYGFKPADDTSIGVIKINNKSELTIMVGPPVNKMQDDDMCRKFLSYDGYKIVCGGTTSHIISRYLHQDIEIDIDYIDDITPPIGHMIGLDLVTEGSITLQKVLEIIQEINQVDSLIYDFSDYHDAAHLVAEYILQKASSINFLIGRALNPHHQKNGFPIDLNSKLKILENIVDEIRKTGREVTVEYY